MVVAGKKIKHRVCNLYDRKPHNVAVEAIVPIISSVATIADVADMILNMVEWIINSNEKLPDTHFA